MADAPPPRLPGVGALDALAAAAAAVHAPPRRPRPESGLSAVADAAAAVAAHQNQRLEAVPGSSHALAQHHVREHPGTLASISEWAPPPQPSLPSVHALPSIAYDGPSAHRLSWHPSSLAQPGLSAPSQMQSGQPADQSSVGLAMPPANVPRLAPSASPLPVATHSWQSSHPSAAYNYAHAPPIHPHHQSVPRQYYYAPVHVQPAREEQVPVQLPPVVVPAHQYVPSVPQEPRREVDIVAHERMESPPARLHHNPPSSSEQPFRNEDNKLRGRSPLPPMLTSPPDLPRSDSALSAVAYVAAAATPLPAEPSRDPQVSALRHDISAHAPQAATSVHEAPTPASETPTPRLETPNPSCEVPAPTREPSAPIREARASRREDPVAPNPTRDVPLAPAPKYEAPEARAPRLQAPVATLEASTPTVRVASGMTEGRARVADMPDTTAAVQVVKASPPTPNFESRALRPEAWSARPEARTVRPEAANSRPEMQSHGPEARSPRLDAQSPRHEARSRRPEARSPRPEARSPRPEARGSRPEARGPRSEARFPRPEARSRRPEAQSPGPEAQNPKPEVQSPKPEPRSPRPEPGSPRPAARSSEPQLLSVEHERPATKPESPRPMPEAASLPMSGTAVIEPEIQSAGPDRMQRKKGTPVALDALADLAMSASPVKSEPVVDKGSSGTSPPVAPPLPQSNEKKRSQRGGAPVETEVKIKSRGRSRVANTTKVEAPASVEKSSKGSTTKLRSAERAEEKKEFLKQGGHDDSGQGGEITRCPCGSTANSSYMVACDECNTWQHYKCMGIRRKGELREDEKYYCHICRPEEMRPNCIAHPRYKERMQNRERERNKDIDPALAGVKPLELRRLFSADLKLQRADPKNFDVGEMFARYAGLFRGQFGKDKQSVIEGLVVVTDMYRADVQSRLESALRKMRGSSGRALAHTVQDPALSSSGPGSDDPSPSGGPAGLEGSGAVGEGYGPNDDHSPSLSDLATEDGQRTRRNAKTGTKRARPTSLTAVVAESGGSKTGDPSIQGGTSGAEQDLATTNEMSRNMSREDRKLFQIMQLFKKQEQQQGRGKKRPRTSAQVDSPKFPQNYSPRQRGVASDSSNDPDGPSPLSVSRPADGSSPERVHDRKVDSTKQASEVNERTKPKVRDSDSVCPNSGRNASEAGLLNSSSELRNRQRDGVEQRKVGKEKDRGSTKERILGGAVRERSRRRGGPNVFVASVPSALAAARRPPSKPASSAAKSSAERPPIDPNLLIRVHAPGPSFLRSQLVPVSRRSSIDVAIDVEEEKRKSRVESLLRLRKKWVPDLQDEGQDEVPKGIPDDGEKMSPALPAKKKWLQLSLEGNADKKNTVCSPPEQEKVGGASCKVEEPGKREEVLVSMVIVSERESLPDNGKQLESSFKREVVMESKPEGCTDAAIPVCEGKGLSAVGDIWNHPLLRRTIVSNRSGPVATCLKKRPVMYPKSRRPISGPSSPAHTASLNLRSSPAPPSSPDSRRALRVPESCKGGSATEKVGSPAPDETKSPVVTPATVPSPKGSATKDLTSSGVRVRPGREQVGEHLRSPSSSTPRVQSASPKKRALSTGELPSPKKVAGPVKNSKEGQAEKARAISVSVAAAGQAPNIPRRPQEVSASETTPTESPVATPSGPAGRTDGPRKPRNDRIPRLGALRSVVPVTSPSATSSYPRRSTSSSPLPGASRGSGFIPGQKRVENEEKCANESTQALGRSPKAGGNTHSGANVAKGSKFGGGSGWLMAGSKSPPASNPRGKYLSSPPWRPPHRFGNSGPMHEGRFSGRGPGSSGNMRNSYPPASGMHGPGRAGNQNGPSSGSPSAATAAWSSFRQRNGWAHPSGPVEDGEQQSGGHPKNVGGSRVNGGIGNGSGVRRHRGGDM